MIFVKIFFIFSIFAFSFQNKVKNYEKLDNIFLEKLNKLLDFCVINPETVDEGTILGILIAKGQIKYLKDAVDAEVLGRKIEDVLKEFERKSGGREVAPFFNSTLFEVNFPVIFGSLTKNHSQFKFTSIKSYVKLVNDDQNQPQGRNSDRCLNEIFKNNCKLSEKCLKIEDPNRKAFGYQLTHKLIYHFLGYIRCRNENFPAISHQICSQIHQESKFIHKVTNILSGSKDLFMEQIFLCSFVGFGEFLNNRWISDILDWQMKSGCFTYDGTNCSSHMNGLAAASLMYFGRLYDEHLF
ncbi:UPF0764 protein C16orf89 homolog [Chironomus tepperi]|uniref:UPF0764 protein C16orf89 homolog n=1 Tax=Chironomus tepperi TaxID=113505 RepID=UPI00391F9D41